MKKKIIIAILAAAFGISAMAYAGVQLMSAQRMYQEGDDAYAEILNNIGRGAGAASAGLGQAAGPGAAGPGNRGGGPGGALSDIGGSANGLAPDDGSGGGPGRGPVTGFMQLDSNGNEISDSFEPTVDFNALRNINRDAAAWLYSPNTVIDYPVMAADDYYYYLGHLPNGANNANGSLFIDYNNAPDFSERLTVIYGHHMKSGKMFGSLVSYKSQKYYDAHPYMFLYTDQANYRIDLLYGSVVGAEEWTENAFMYEENVAGLLDFAARNSTFKSGALYTEGDKIVVLSTCSYEFDEARYFVLGMLKEII